MKVTIIGAGLGGLACGALLARAGVKVTIVERKHEIGGRATSQKENGFVFDQGPHALYRGGPAEKLLRELGVPIEGRSPRAEGSLALVGDRLVMLPIGFSTMLSTDLLPWRAKMEMSFLLARLDSLRAEGDETVSAWIEKHLAQPSARMLMHALVRLTTYSNAPEIMRASIALEQIKQRMKNNVLYLDGGWQSLVDGLEKVARDAGVEILLGDREAKIEGEVILACGPRAAKSADPTIVRETIPVYAAVLQVGVHDLPKPEHRFALGIDRPYYLAVPSFTAAYAPEGHHAINVAKYLGRDEHATEEELEHALDVFQPGWRDHVVAKRFLPHLVVMNEVPGRGTPIPNVVGDWVSEHPLLDGVMDSARRVADTLLGKESIAAA